MKIEDLFNQQNIIELSFYNFRNAITAAYFANNELEILKVNDNFKSFFPVLGNVTNVYFPDVLEQLGVSGDQIESFITDMNEKGTVLIPQVHIRINDEDRVFSLLSTRTHDDAFASSVIRIPVSGEEDGDIDIAGLGRRQYRPVHLGKRDA